MRRRLWMVVAAVAALVVLALTLTPTPPTAAPPTLWRLLGAELGLADFIGNIALFLPLGVALSAARRGVRSAVIGAAVLSAMVEVTQGFFVPGRDASLGDFAANVIGGASGGWIAVHAGLLLWPTRRYALRLAAVATVAAMLVLCAVAWLFAPGRPSRGYEGQYGAHWYGHPGLALGVVRASINGAPFGWEAIAGAPGISRELESERVVLEIDVVPGAPLEGASRLAAVIADDAEHASLARFEADGRDLVFSVRTRAGAAGLRDPWLRLRNALPARGPDARQAPPADWAAPLIAGRDTLRLRGARDGNRLTVRARARTGGDSTSLRLDVTRGWMLLVPISMTPRDDGAWWSALWLVVLFGPAAYWVVRGAVMQGDARA